MSVVRAEPVLCLSGLSYRWPGATQALLHIDDWQLLPRERVLVLGPSGSGKSTLLLAISLIQPPTTGRIVVDGQTLYDNGPTGVNDRAFRLRKVGFIFQQHNLIPFLTAKENVALVAILP